MHQVGHIGNVRISRKWVNTFKGVGVRLADFISFF